MTDKLTQEEIIQAINVYQQNVSKAHKFSNLFDFITFLNGMPRAYNPLEIVKLSKMHQTQVYRTRDKLDDIGWLRRVSNGYKLNYEVIRKWASQPVDREIKTKLPIEVEIELKHMPFHVELDAAWIKSQYIGSLIKLARALLKGEVKWNSKIEKILGYDRCNDMDGLTVREVLHRIEDEMLTRTVEPMWKSYSYYTILCGLLSDRVEWVANLPIEDEYMPKDYYHLDEMILMIADNRNLYFNT